jgi:putative transposase
MTEDTTEALTGAIRVEEQQLRGHIDEAGRSGVDETLNGLLEAEADAIFGAGRYERSVDRVDIPELVTTSVIWKATPRSPQFETAIVERYRRREASLEEALVERYLAGVSVRRVEDITEALWGTRVSPGTVSPGTLSRLTQKIYRHIEAWHTRLIDGAFAYLYLDGVVLKRSWPAKRAMSRCGWRSAWAPMVSGKFSLSPRARRTIWRAGGFLRCLKERGLSGVRLIISEGCLGLVEAGTEFLADAQWQRCTVRWYRNVFSHIPNGIVAEVARMLKEIQAQGDRVRAQAKIQEVLTKLKAMRLPEAAELVASKRHETLAYFAFPSTHWRQIRTNNPLECIIREISRPPARRPRLPRQSQRVDARGRKTAPHRINALGKPALPCDGDATHPCSPEGGSLKTRPRCR